MGWTIGVLGLDSQQGLGIFLLTTTVSRMALGPTQTPLVSTGTTFTLPFTDSHSMQGVGCLFKVSPPVTLTLLIILYFESFHFMLV
jgi:hypothetical protein